ncbi:MAG: NepR family anti-sigma factor [Microvirga sp.]
MFRQGANSYVLCDIVSGRGKLTRGPGVAGRTCSRGRWTRVHRSVSLGLSAPPSASDAELLAEIGGALRRVYSELLREPIPEHLAVIIERLGTRSLKPH